MTDDNFLKENNAYHVWRPMAHPAESLTNAPKIITGAFGLRKNCDRHGIPLIADELSTGSSRTGSWTGSRHGYVQPDFACTAKATAIANTNADCPFGAAMIADAGAKVFDATDAAVATARISGQNLILWPPLVVSADDVVQIVAARNTGLAAA